MAFIRVNDIVTHFSVAGPNEGPATVFINSLGTDFRIWDAVAPAFSESMRVIRYDMRGHGYSMRSGKPSACPMGVKLVEQPVPAWNIAGRARLRARPGTPPVLADECVFDTHDMMQVAQAGAADAVSLKLVKHAGLLGLRKVASVAEAAGIGLYGGCLLESSVGAAAHLQIFSTLRELAWGCEHFGPQILAEDLVTEPLRFEDFHVHLPTGPGIGVMLDEDKLRHFTRN